MDVFKSGIKIFLAKVGTSLVSFTAVVIFSQGLGASPLGSYYPFIAILGLLAIPANFGLRGAAEKRISEGEDQSEYLGTVILLKLPPIILLAGVIVFAGESIDQYLGANLADLLVIGLLLHEVGRLGLFVLRGELRPGETAVAQILQPIGWLVVGYYLYMQGFGIRGLVYGYLAGALAMSIVAWWKISIRPSLPSVKHARSLLEYSRYSVISRVGSYFYSWMDIAILTLFVSLEIASSRAGIGAYENAWRVSLLVTMLSRSISLSMFPQISRWSAEDATDRIEGIIPSALLPGLLIVFPAFAGTIVLSTDILRILFGPEFTIASIALVILMGEKLFQSVHTVLSRSLQAIDRPDLAAYATAVAIVLNLVLNVALIWEFGLVGAAIATAVSFGANTVLHAYYLRQFVKIDLPVREAGWSAISASVMGTVVYALTESYEIAGPIELLGTVFVGGIVYCLVVLLYAPIRAEAIALATPVLRKRIA